MQDVSKEQVSAVMKAMRAKVSPENCKRSSEACRRAQAASVLARLSKKDKAQASAVR